MSPNRSFSFAGWLSMLLFAPQLSLAFNPRYRIRHYQRPA